MPAKAIYIEKESKTVEMIQASGSQDMLPKTHVVKQIKKSSKRNQP